jgi:hypothetical protein
VCGHQVAAGPEVGRDAAERGQEPLGPRPRSGSPSVPVRATWSANWL